MDEVDFRGFTISKDDLVQAMAEFDARVRTDFINWRKFGIQHDDKLYPPKELIRIATNREIGRFSGGQNAANQVFSRLGFDVVLLDDIDISDEDIEDAIDTSFSLERDLERILVSDLSSVEEDLELYSEGDKTGVQFDTGVVGRIDILASDAQGRFVVIELKAGEASDRVCGQILRYMGLVSQEKSAGKDVRGIIIANEFDARIEYAASMVPHLDLLKYDVSFQISQIGRLSESA